MWTTRVVWIAALVASLVMVAGASVFEVEAAGWLSTLGPGGAAADRPSDLLVQVKKKKKTQGERSCPVGYKVLDKPNKYGAFCEPADGLPAPEAEKCKLGMVGTPPNCACPKGYTFFGYKGCLKRKNCSYYSTLAQAAELQPDFIAKCAGYPVLGMPVCENVSGVPGDPTVFQCCCY